MTAPYRRIEVAALDHQGRPTAEAIVDVQRASYAVEADLIGYDQMPGLIEDAEDVAGLDLTILGAFVRYELVGVLGYAREGDVVDVDRLAVHPSHFRRGVARRLLRALHRSEDAAVRFDVSTGAANEPALALYRSLGYRVTSTEELQGVLVSHLARTPRRQGGSGTKS